MSVAFVVAVFISNLPESFSATTEFERARHSTRWILRLWIGIALASALAAGLGYEFLGGASEDLLARDQGVRRRRDPVHARDRDDAQARSEDSDKSLGDRASSPSSASPSRPG